MANSPIFNFSLPSPQTLVGICVEASDDFVEKIPDDRAIVHQVPIVETTLRPEDLFGLTLNVDDISAPAHFDATGST